MSDKPVAVVGRPVRLLGIDAGGTFTDAVLVDPETGMVTKKAKALTTPIDLSVGIRNVLNLLLADQEQTISLVSLSTTLATNSVVEGHGGRVGLILIGYDRQLVLHHALEARLPVEKMVLITGGHDVKGNAVQVLDRETAEAAALSLFPLVDAFAVSGYFSVMNPEHEIAVSEIIRQHGDKPIVCGHELTSQLDAIKRVSTAVLNARLLPVIGQLMDAVKSALFEWGVDAPRMVLKGDGTMFNERSARLRPVETILSGPAASAIGAQHLSQIDQAVVVDMGGTTTDIANLENGLPWTNPDGATVGDWQTCVRAADLRSIGLGGDSHITIDQYGKLAIGPKRAIPLARLGEDYPGIVAEIEAAIHAGSGERHIRPIEFLVIVRKWTAQSFGEPDHEILRALEPGPRSLASLEREFGHRIVDTRNLETAGVLRRCALTPTDILWSDAGGVVGNQAASRAGSRLFAGYLGISTQELKDKVVDAMVNTIAVEVFNKLVQDETGNRLIPALSPWKVLFDQALNHASMRFVDVDFTVKKPIVAIGAPVEAFMPWVAHRLQTQCIIPDHAEVGNAVGAAVALVSQSVEVLVQPLVKGSGTVSYLIHSARGREEEASLAKAVRRAETLAREMARKAAYQAGAVNVEVRLEKKQVVMGNMAEVTVRATANGKPKELKVT